MFEYLLPAVWMRSYPETLLQRSMEAAVGIQQAYGDEHRVPWGVSECAFAVQDENGVYGYRAFGVPALAVHQEEAALGGRSLRHHAGAGFRSRSCDQESAMDEPKRIGSDATAFMKPSTSAPTRAATGANRSPSCGSGWLHHQGMSLLAMANFLRQGVVRNWFHADARVQATELLLQERPLGRPVGTQAKRRTRKGNAPQLLTSPKVPSLLSR